MCMGQMCSSKTCLFSSMHWIIIDAWSVVVMLLAKFLLIHHCTVTFLEFHFFSSVNLPVCVSYLWLSLHLALVSRCCSSMPIFVAAGTLDMWRWITLLFGGRFGWKRLTNAGQLVTSYCNRQWTSIWRRTCSGIEFGGHSVVLRLDDMMGGRFGLWARFAWLLANKLFISI